MGYTERFGKSLEKGRTKAISQDIYTWEVEDQQLIGELVDITPFTDGKFETEVNCYIFDTDEGRVSTVLGSSTDKRMTEHVKIGDLVRITFKGKKHLEDGRSVNRFQIEKAT